VRLWGRLRIISGSAELSGTWREVERKTTRLRCSKFAACGYQGNAVTDARDLWMATSTRGERSMIRRGLDP
jgi:hypothetical protein